MSLSIEHLARALKNDASEAHLRFCLNRQVLACAVILWIDEGPSRSDVQEEIDGTISLLRQLGQLAHLAAE